MPRENIAAILCRRDGITFKEAEERINQTIQEIEDSNGDYDAAEDIMMTNLGLEMDYLTDLF